MSSKSAQNRRLMKERNPEKYEEFLRKMRERARNRRKVLEAKYKEGKLTPSQMRKYEYNKAVNIILTKARYHQQKLRESGIQQQRGMANSSESSDPHRKWHKTLRPDELRTYNTWLRKTQRQRLQGVKTENVKDSDKAELHQMNLEDDSETVNKDYPTPISSAQLETSCSHSPKKLALKMVFDSGENGDEKMVFTVLAEPDRKSGQALETSVPPLLAGSEPHQWKTLVDFPAPVPMSTCTIEPCRKLRKRSALTSSADVQRDKIQTVEHPYSLTAPEKMPRRAGKISTLSISADVERNYCKILSSPASSSANIEMKCIQMKQSAPPSLIINSERNTHPSPQKWELSLPADINIKQPKDLSPAELEEHQDKTYMRRKERSGFSDPKVAHSPTPLVCAQSLLPPSQPPQGKVQRFHTSSVNSTMNSLDTVVSKLKKLAPLHLAGSWDNVGLLVEPSAPKYISKVMLTNDLTAKVMEEAKDHTVDLILSYHPPIFVPLKRLTQRNWKERIVVECMENRIAVFSPHTSHDAVEGGVNDWLISAFDVKKPSVRPVEPNQEFPGGQSHLLEVNITDPSRIKEVRDQCLVSQLDPDARLRQNKEAFTMHSVKSSTSSAGEEWRLQVACDQEELASMLKGLALSGSREKYQVSQLTQVPMTSTGMGRWAELKAPISLQEAVIKVKAHLEIDHVMVAQRQDQDSYEPGDNAAAISTVAVCAGSGAGVLKGVKADLLLTGELSHHEVLDAVHKGSHVILARHSNSERGYLKHLKAKVETALGPSVEVFVSSVDKDPLVVV